MLRPAPRTPFPEKSSPTSTALHPETIVEVQQPG